MPTHLLKEDVLDTLGGDTQLFKYNVTNISLGNTYTVFKAEQPFTLKTVDVSNQAVQGLPNPITIDIYRLENGSSLDGKVKVHSVTKTGVYNGTNTIDVDFRFPADGKYYAIQDASANRKSAYKNATPPTPQVPNVISSLQSYGDSGVKDEYPILNWNIQIEGSIASQLAQTSNKNDNFRFNKVKFISHAGFQRVAPSNSRPAFELAGKYGFWGAENDTRKTLDSEWVLAHSDELIDISDVQGKISEKTLAELKAINVTKGSNANKYPLLKILTFAEYLDVCKKSNLVPIIEIKGMWFTELEYDRFVDILRKSGLENKCVVMCFNDLPLTKVRERSQSVILWKLGDINQTNIDFLKDLKNSGFSTEYTTITKELIELAHDNRLTVGAYTVNDYAQIRNLINMGVDYITTDIVVGEAI